MKPLIKFFLILFFLSSFSVSIQGSFPNEHLLIIEEENTTTNNALRKALNISSIRILGSKNEFDQNKKLIQNLLPETYIKSYEFINQNKIKITVNAKLLRNEFLDNNLSISIEDNISISAWILCKTNLRSKSEYDLLAKKCKKLKKEISNMALERDINLVYPIFDANDLNFLDIEQKKERLDNSFINDRYLSNESFYCEITLMEDKCFKTKASKNNKIDFSKTYSIINIFNSTVDSAQKIKKVYLNKNSFKPISINISNISSIEEYNLVFQELENIIFFDNLSLSSLTNDDVIFSSNLLGKVSDIEKIFRTKKNFKINSINYKKISIEFNPLKDA
jgi:hypothetical protein